MKRFNRQQYFGDAKKSRIPLLNAYQAEIDIRLSKLHDYNHPLMSGSYSVDIYNYLKDRTLNTEPMNPEDVFDYMMYYFNNLPDWSNPGTMINVIPTVNLVSASVSGIAELFNPNCAQDTYSGNLLIAELEVIKYMSDQIGWDWTESTGLFTFGGTGTNMYATKLALMNADLESASKGAVRGKYFFITSESGHPCHYQLCDWLGLGRDTCIEAPCTKNGQIDITKTTEIVRSNLCIGKTFLGFNLTGGSTNEMLIDSTKEIYQLRENVVKEFDLDYRPLIHVDSVLGWVYLFFKNYDFISNPLKYPSDILNILKSLYYKVSQFSYADTIGIDFHKTGFCPYVTSLFLVKNKSQYFKLNPTQTYDIHTMGYGDYNPFYTSLEYSRSAKGPVAALACLKSLGSSAFCELIGDLTDAALYFRKFLENDPRICIINPETEGFATIFSLIPPDLNIRSVSDIELLSESALAQIRDINITFGKKVLSDCVKHNKHFIFTSSRSYTLPGTNIKIGALKAYPMSIYFDRNNALSIAREILESVSELFNNLKGQKDLDDFDLFEDMSRE